MIYSWKVRLLKIPYLNYLWRYWQGWRGNQVGNYTDLPSIIAQYAPNGSFVDIGCMWGVNGAYAFAAEEAGATSVKGVDVFGPTPEFEATRSERNSNVEFILGDITSPNTIANVGQIDVVFCAGVLYHHPSPFDLLVALRRMCRQKLILRTSTIPEINGLANAAVYYPMLSETDRKLWNLSQLGLPYQAGITDEFQPDQGYGNWFWGLTPSCLEALLHTAGFRIEWRATEPFAQTVVCMPVKPPFDHRLPNEEEAKREGTLISSSGRAQPA